MLIVRRPFIVSVIPILAALLITPRAHAVLIGVEAEAFVTETGNGFDVVADAAASGGSYITTASSRLATPPVNTAVYELGLPSGNSYKLWGRVGALSTPPGRQFNDSMFIPTAFGISPGFAQRNRITVDPWTWVNLSGALSYSPGPEPQTFIIGGREDGFLIDGFVFATEADPSDSDLDAALLANEGVFVEPGPEPGVVPEPATAGLALLGLAACLPLRRRSISS